MLMDFIEGRLPGRMRRHLEDHVSGCDRCLEQVIGVRDVSLSALAGNAVSQRVTQRTIQVVSRLDPGRWWDRAVGHFRAIILRWSCLKERRGFMHRQHPATVRGEPNMLSGHLFEVRKKFTELEAEIEIEKISDRTVSVQVNRAASSHANQPVRVSLLQNQREIASFLLTDGPVRFEGLPFGPYTLEFKCNGLKQGEYLFVVKEDGYGSI
jgi:hypothetical protein